MADPDELNPKIVKAVEITNKAVIDPDVVKVEGAGSSYQAVAQSMALSVQDASTLLRNVSTIATTAIGVATAKFIEEKDPKMLVIIQQSQDMITKTAETFKTIGTNSGEVLKSFPHGE